MFPHDCGDINDLININIAATGDSYFDSGSGPRRYATFDSGSEEQPEEPPEEPRMIGDFDGSSNVLWTLFRDETKSHDDARINTLKDDMESALIFVRSYPAPTMGFAMLIRGLTGRFIFRCPHCIRTR